MLVIVLCSLLWEATTEVSASHSRQLGCSGGRGREEAARLQPTTVHATDLGMRQSVILNKSRPYVDTIESIVSGRRGFAGCCQVCFVKQPWRQHIRYAY